MPFTLRNLREDLEDLGSNFDGAPDLEFRMASKALELEQSGTSRSSCSVRPISAKIREKTSRVSGTGGLTNSASHLGRAHSPGEQLLQPRRAVK
ncbi:MAG: hypothetical protein ABSB69_17180 [Solirubrobacteraceae bacterium]